MRHKWYKSHFFGEINRLELFHSDSSENVGRVAHGQKQNSDLGQAALERLETWLRFVLWRQKAWLDLEQTRPHKFCSNQILHKIPGFICLSWTVIHKCNFKKILSDTLTQDIVLKDVWPHVWNCEWKGERTVCGSASPDWGPDGFTSKLFMSCGKRSGRGCERKHLTNH